MKLEISEALWLDAQQTYTLDEVSAQSGLPGELLQQLVEFGALPAHRAATALFSGDCVALARRASRLHNDFELDAHALALVLRLLERVSTLENEMRALQARLPQHLL